MTLTVQPDTLAWGNESRTMMIAQVSSTGAAPFAPVHLCENDPVAAYAAIWTAATATPPAYGAILDYTPAAPVPPATSIPPMPPLTPPAPVVATPMPIDWAAVCALHIAQIYTVNGVNVRSSMNVWAAAVALTPPAQWSADDAVCAAMTPQLNSWEGNCFLERDRCAALPGATLASANWPAVPAGAMAFIASCAQG